MLDLDFKYPKSAVITVKAAAGTLVKRLQHQDCGLSDGLHEPASDLARWTLKPWDDSHCVLQLHRRRELGMSGIERRFRRHFGLTATCFGCCFSNTRLDW
jgi:hypothetical protein